MSVAPAATLASWFGFLLEGNRTYEVVFLGSTFVAIVATAMAIRVARAMRILDQPGVRKIHASAIPRIGGAAIVFALLATTLPVLALDNPIGKALRQDQSQILAILAGGMFIFAIGLLDDVRGLRPHTKLLAQVAAAAVVCASGARIETLHFGEGLAPPLGPLAWPMTMLWIVGITNAVNLIDGLDGLAAGISLITCAVLAAFAFYVGQPVVAVFMLALLGSLIGFLFLNFNPARVFMGDCGSMFLGFVIAAMSVFCAERSASAVGLALPFLALGVPIFDTLFSILRRILARRSIFSGDRGHIHHRLLARGLTQSQVAIIVCTVTLIAAGLGAFMIFINGLGMLAIFGFVIFLLLLAFRAAGAVRLRETLAASRQYVSRARQVRADNRAFDAMWLELGEAADFEQWWTALCRIAETLGLLRLALHVPNGDGTSRTLLWRRPGQDSSPGRKVTVWLPVGQHPGGGDLAGEVDVRLDGSLEAAGRRVMLLGRLLDERGTANLPLPTPQESPEAARPVQAPAAAVPATTDKRQALERSGPARDSVAEEPA